MGLPKVGEKVESKYSTWDNGDGIWTDDERELAQSAGAFEEAAAPASQPPSNPTPTETTARRRGRGQPTPSSSKSSGGSSGSSEKKPSASSASTAARQSITYNGDAIQGADTDLSQFVGSSSSSISPSTGEDRVEVSNTTTTQLLSRGFKEKDSDVAVTEQEQIEFGTILAGDLQRADTTAIARVPVQSAPTPAPAQIASDPATLTPPVAAPAASPASTTTTPQIPTPAPSATTKPSVATTQGQVQTSRSQVLQALTTSNVRIDNEGLRTAGSSNPSDILAQVEPLPAAVPNPQDPSGRSQISVDWTKKEFKESQRYKSHQDALKMKGTALEGIVEFKHETDDVTKPAQLTFVSGAAVTETHVVEMARATIPNFDSMNDVQQSWVLQNIREKAGLTETDYQGRVRYLYDNRSSFTPGEDNDRYGGMFGRQRQAPTDPIFSTDPKVNPFDILRSEFSVLDKSEKGGRRDPSDKSKSLYERFSEDLDKLEGELPSDSRQRWAAAYNLASLSRGKPLEDRLRDVRSVLGQAIGSKNPQSIPDLLPHVENADLRTALETATTTTAASRAAYESARQAPEVATVDSSNSAIEKLEQVQADAEEYETQLTALQAAPDAATQLKATFDTTPSTTKKTPFSEGTGIFTDAIATQFSDIQSQIDSLDPTSPTFFDTAEKLKAKLETLPVLTEAHLASPNHPAASERSAAVGNFNARIDNLRTAFKPIEAAVQAREELPEVLQGLPADQLLQGSEAIQAAAQASIDATRQTRNTARQSEAYQTYEDSKKKMETDETALEKVERNLQSPEDYHKAGKALRHFDKDAKDPQLTDFDEETRERVMQNMKDAKEVREIQQDKRKKTFDEIKSFWDQGFKGIKDVTTAITDFRELAEKFAKNVSPYANKMLEGMIDVNKETLSRINDPQKRLEKLQKMQDGFNKYTEKYFERLEKRKAKGAAESLAVRAEAILTRDEKGRARFGQFLDTKTPGNEKTEAETASAKADARKKDAQAQLAQARASYRNGFV